MKYILITITFISAALLTFSYPLAKKGVYTLFLNQLVYRHTVDLLLCDSLHEGQVLLDTRSRREFEISHLPNAIYVGFEDFALNKVTKWPKDKPLVLYCSIGYRSERIGEMLKKEGYSRVYNLEGGAFEYVNRGLPLDGGDVEEKELIHPYSMWWGIWLSRGQKKY